MRLQHGVLLIPMKNMRAFLRCTAVFFFFSIVLLSLSAVAADTSEPVTSQTISGKKLSLEMRKRMLSLELSTLKDKQRRARRQQRELLEQEKELLRLERQLQSRSEQPGVVVPAKSAAAEGQGRPAVSGTPAAEPPASGQLAAERSALEEARQQVQDHRAQLQALIENLRLELERQRLEREAFRSRQEQRRSVAAESVQYRAELDRASSELKQCNASLAEAREKEKELVRQQRQLLIARERDTQQEDALAIRDAQEQNRRIAAAFAEERGRLQQAQQEQDRLSGELAGRIDDLLRKQESLLRQGRKLEQDLLSQKQQLDNMTAAVRPSQKE